MSSLEELSIRSLGQRMQTVFALPTPPMELSTEDRLHLAYRRAREGQTELKYPILAYTLSSMGPQDYHNVTVSAFQVVKTRTTSDFMHGLRLYPTKFTFDITYLDDSRTSLVSFLSAWTRAAANGSLTFRLLVDGYPIDIQVKPDPNLSVPKKDVNTDTTNQFEFTGSIVMSTYLTGPFTSEIKKIARIKETTIGFIQTTPSSPALIRGRSPIPEPEQIEVEMAAYDPSVRADNLLFDLIVTESRTLIREPV